MCVVRSTAVGMEKPGERAHDTRMSTTHSLPQHDDDPAIERIRERMAAAIVRHLDGRNEAATAVAGLNIYRCGHTTAPGSYLYAPCFALIVRGTKRVVLGDETYVYDERQFLLTAVNLPTIVQVIGATDDAPYLSLKLDVDLELARELIAEVDAVGAGKGEGGRGMALGAVTPELASATMRLIDLLDAPGDIPILARGIQREILYRVLSSPAGVRLRQAVQVGTQTHRVATAIQWIHDHYRRPLRIDELARAAGMGQSTLHRHFRVLAGMSPLQYQKQLRLNEARRLMLSDQLHAGVAARHVGYESEAQFNREYRRLFGAPPKRDVRELRDRPGRGE